MIHYDDQTQRDHHAQLAEWTRWLEPIDPWEMLRITIAVSTTPKPEMTSKWITAWRRE